MLVPVKEGWTLREKLGGAWDRSQGCPLQGGSRRPQELGFTAARPFFLQGQPPATREHPTPLQPGPPSAMPG